MMMRKLIAAAAAFAVVLGVSVFLPQTASVIGTDIETDALKFDPDTYYDKDYAELAGDGFTVPADMKFTTAGTSGNVRVDGVFSCSNGYTEAGDTFEGITEIKAREEEYGYWLELTVPGDPYDQKINVYKSYTALTVLSYDSEDDIWVIGETRDPSVTSLGYSEPEIYYITIPAEVRLGESMEIKSGDVTLHEGESIMVSVGGTSDEENRFRLAHSGVGDDYVEYNIVKYGTEKPLVIGEQILTAATGDEEKTQKLVFQGPLEEKPPQYAGKYEGTVTFDVKVLKTHGIMLAEGAAFVFTYADGMTFKEIAALPENEGSFIDKDGYFRVPIYGYMYRVSYYPETEGHKYFRGDDVFTERSPIGLYGVDPHEYHGTLVMGPEEEDRRQFYFEEDDTWEELNNRPCNEDLHFDASGEYLRFKYNNRDCLVVDNYGEVIKSEDSVTKNWAYSFAIDTTGDYEAGIGTIDLKDSENKITFTFEPGMTFAEIAAIPENNLVIDSGVMKADVGGTLYTLTKRRKTGSGYVYDAFASDNKPIPFEIYYAGYGT